MAQSIRAAVVQLCAREIVDRNLAVAAELVLRAAGQGAQLVVLPENFAFLGGLAESCEIAEAVGPAVDPAVAPDDAGPILTRMIALAREARVHLLLGGMPVRASTPDRIFNTAILLDPAGCIAAIYRKIHLFDIDIPGHAVMSESTHVLPGDSPVAVSLLGTTLGLSICYDLRFPELYRALSLQGAELCAVPAAFTQHTGKDHWFPLLRARAIENQVYILAAAQHGRHNDKRTSYGKSCIIDPWGAVIAQVPDQDGIALADLDLDYLRQVRRQLPCLQHRRLP